MNRGAKKKIRVLVVEDSPVVRELLLNLLQSDPEIEVAGVAVDGEEAVALAAKLKPDVITMDINLPKMNGFDATRLIMEQSPAPIVIVSGNWSPREVATTFRAVECGALAVLARPAGAGHKDFRPSTREFLNTVKLMSEVKVVRRRFARNPVAPLPISAPPAPSPEEIRLVAVGASTGGPGALQILLSNLPADFPAPILLVQHIAAGFTSGLVEWLGRCSKLPVRLAVMGERPLRGHVYVAPDGVHFGLDSEGRVALSSSDPENGLRPSVSFLFRSVAAFYGRQCAAVLLTGMGKDGAQELKQLRDLGAMTLAQDQASSVVYGMPGEAARLGAAAWTLPPEGLAATLIQLTSRSGANKLSAV